MLYYWYCIKGQLGQKQEIEKMQRRRNLSTSSTGPLRRSDNSPTHKPVVLKNASAGYQGNMDNIKKDLDVVGGGGVGGPSQEEADLLDLLG